MDYVVKDIKLAAQGANQVSFARQHMAPLLEVEKQFLRTKPFKGLRIGMALHLTKETAVLVEVLRSGGADVSIASCNPLSTQDDVAAYLAKSGIKVFGYKGENKADYYKYIRAVILNEPHITIDDGCDLVSEIHLHHTHLIAKLIGGCEETTTGITRLKAMAADNALKYPIVAVNDNLTKHLFDNYYGTGQSTWDGIVRATNILLAGKTVVVAGYGDCGRGVALRARGLGAQVIVTEVNPVRALQAKMDGAEVMTMMNASTRGDVFVTVTGNKNVITAAHTAGMKPGAILANSGHFNCEIDIESIEKRARSKKTVRPALVEYEMGTAKRPKSLFIIADGRLVNLAAAEGHPSEVMALSFCGQALAAAWLVEQKKKLAPKGLTPGVYTLPDSIDAHIARLTLTSLGLGIDTLTKEQREYAESWREGT